VSAGTETVFAKYTVVLALVGVIPSAPAVVRPSINKSTSAAFVPSTFATDILFIFKILSESTVIKVEVVVDDKLKPILPALIVATFTIFGFAIIVSFYPKIKANAIAFPVDIGEESKVN
jgi:hypothetical protein